MANLDQSANPYAPPSSFIEKIHPPDVAKVDEIQDDLNRAFYAATYGTLFLPGLAYCVALFVLAQVSLKQKEFLPEHHKQFTITSVICLLQAPFMLLGLLALLGALAIEIVS